MSTAEAFRRLLFDCEFTGAEEQAYETHRDQVRRRLVSSFDVVDVVDFGSYTRGSAIRQSSDLDLLLVLRQHEVTRGGFSKSSATVLRAVRDALSERFPSTKVGLDKQAVGVDFNRGRRVEVVPAWWREARTDGWPIYAIPDGSGSWTGTSPKRHAKYIADADRRSGGKLKHVARLLKYWRVSRASMVPINSFYVEMLMANTDICLVGSTYAECFASLLNALRELECASFEDPLGISEGVDACGSAAKQDRALAVVGASAERAMRAVEAEHRGEIREAFRLWNLVFNGTFPASRSRLSESRR